MAPLDSRRRAMQNLGQAFDDIEEAVLSSLSDGLVVVGRRINAQTPPCRRCRGPCTLTTLCAARPQLSGPL
jgi:hypothetical protein